MLAQWARQNNFEVVTDWMMTWSAVLPRRKARLVQSVLACARNPLRAPKGTHPPRQCLAMCQSFQARRTLQSAAACVRAYDVQVLRPALQDALWILCSLWGKVEIHFCKDESTGVTAYELQAEEDYRPDVLSVPLCGAGLKEEEILSHIN